MSVTAFQHLSKPLVEQLQGHEEVLCGPGGLLKDGRVVHALLVLSNVLVFLEQGDSFASQLLLVDTPVVSIALYDDSLDLDLNLAM